MNNFLITLYATRHYEWIFAGQGEEEEKEEQVDDGESPAHLPVPVRVFVVLYDYDPEQSSPNDQPDLELYLRTGEYVFIYGEMDEASFLGTLLCIVITYASPHFWHYIIADYL